MNVRITLAAVLAALSAAALTAQQAPAPVPAQEQPPVIFRVDVEFVEVDAIVTDAQGNPVTDLTIDDFEVLEDGQRQTLTAFSMVDLPVERAERPLFSAAPIEPDVLSNVGGEGRIYLFVLDDLHTEFQRSVQVRTAAREFVERYFGANDLAAIAYTSGRARESQDFTSNRRLLLASIDKFTGRKVPFNDPLGDANIARSEGESNARTSMRSVARLADFMAGVRGRRKAMLLFSEGIDFDVFNIAGATAAGDIIGNSSAATAATSAAILEESRIAVAAATRGNVAIYAVDPRGLPTPSDATAATSFGGPGPISIAGDPVRGPGVAPALRQVQLSQDSLRVLAADTGGFASVNRNDFTEAFARIVRENSTYYVMGYYPSNARRDGRFRRIEVRVRRPGLQVRSRSGYIEPRGRAAAAAAAAPAADPLVSAVNDAVASPLPVSGLPLRVVAMPFKGTAPNAAVALAIDLDTRGFRFTESDGMLTSRMHVSVVATDTESKIRGTDSNSANMRFRPESIEAARAGGFRFLTQIDLPPGRYQLRVAAGEGDRTGSIVYDLVVPDFYDERVAMSGIALTSAGSARTPTARPKDPLADFLPAPPTTARVFAGGDTLALFAEFYENMPGAPPHMFDITTTLRADGGTVVFENFDTRSSTELRGGRGGFGYTVEIPLTGMAPGVYVLRVEGASRAGNLPPVGRDIEITVQ